MESLPEITPHTSLVRQMKTLKPETTIKNRDIIAAIKQVEDQLKALTPQEFPYIDEKLPADHEVDWDPIYEVGDTDPAIQPSSDTDLVGST